MTDNFAKELKKTHNGTLKDLINEMHTLEQKLAKSMTGQQYMNIIYSKKMQLFDLYIGIKNEEITYYTTYNNYLKETIKAYKL